MPRRRSDSGRAILVTGASGGLGRPLALACAARGATVVLHGRIVRKLEALYDEIVAAGHPQPTILPLDLATATRADFDNGRRRVARAARPPRRSGPHGGVPRFAGPHRAPVARRCGGPLFDINVIAAIALTRASLPLLAAAADACVVFTLDTRGVAPRAFWGAYAASKAALAALARDARRRMGNASNLRVNAVVPGPMQLAAPRPHASRRGKVRTAGARSARAPLSAPARRPVEGGKRRPRRRPRLARWSARVDAARDVVDGRTAVAQQHSQSSEVVAGQRVGQDQDRSGGTYHRASSARQTIVVTRVPTYDASRMEPSRVRPSRAVTASLRSMPT